MLKENYTDVTEFILLGLTDRADLHPVLFVVFLVIYVITIVSNVGMILLIRTDSKLQTPMYFFLSHLSFIDLCYATISTQQNTLVCTSTVLWTIGKTTAKKAGKLKMALAMALDSVSISNQPEQVKKVRPIGRAFLCLDEQKLKSKKSPSLTYKYVAAGHS